MSVDPRTALDDGLESLGLDVPAVARDAMILHLDLVRDANRTTNLTRITESAAMVRDHVLDALALLTALDEAGLVVPSEARYLDVGTGAGFPGLPIALARSGFSVVLAESRGPKARFLRSVVSTLGLAGRITVRPLRARELHHHHPEHAESFDLVTARAVANVSRVLREVKAVVAPAGLVVHFKGPGLDDAERSAGARDAQRYGFDTLPEIDARTPGRDRRYVVHRRRRAQG